MPMFNVLVREVHVSYVLVEAETAELAIASVKTGIGIPGELEYSHTLPEDTWTTEEIK